MPVSGQKKIGHNIQFCPILILQKQLCENNICRHAQHLVQATGNVET